MGPQDNSAPPQQGQPVPGGQPQQGGAEDAIKMIQDGFMALGQMMQQSGDQLPPDDVKLFQAAAQATDAFIQAITSGGEPDADDKPQAPPQAPQKKSPGGPMPANANKGAQPAPQY